MAQDNSRIAYRHPQPKETPPELVIPSVIPADDRVWVPQAENVWFRPLCLCASRGYWMNLLKVRKSGVLSRHRHPQPVHGYVLKGRWRYLEHDWVAQEGGYVYEAPGETHTLVVDEDVPEMITLLGAPVSRTCSLARAIKPRLVLSSDSAAERSNTRPETWSSTNKCCRNCCRPGANV